MVESPMHLLDFRGHKLSIFGKLWLAFRSQSACDCDLLGMPLFSDTARRSSHFIVNERLSGKDLVS